MSYDPLQLRIYVIRPVLQEMQLWSAAAEELLMLTSAHESHLGKYIMQIDARGYPSGPARGIFGMEPATHDDCWTWLGYPQFAHYRRAVLKWMVPGPGGVDQLLWNHAYAAALCRIQYWRARPPLPPASNVQALAEYWDEHWNKNEAKGFPHQAVADYNRLVLKSAA
jgi:hypothetical protein